MNSKRIFITGATGFLGTHLVSLLVECGFDVTALMRTRSRADSVDQVVHKKITWCVDETEIDQAFEKGIDCVIHLATCYGREKDTFADVVQANLLLPVMILEKALSSGCKGFINTDTFFHEKLGLKPKEKSYITTKKLFLDLARDMVLESNIKFFNMRIEQMYGPGDSREKFITSIIRQLASAEPTVRLTRGEQKRDMIYVEDAAQAFVSAVQHLDSCEKWEEFGIGTGTSVSVQEVVMFLKQTIESPSMLEWGAIPYREHEIMDSKAELGNNEKIAWKARVFWKEGLERTIKSISSEV